MCLIKIRREEDEDEYVPYRRVVHRERIRTASPRRSSKVVVVPPREGPFVVPPPQPVPLFVDPPPPAPVVAPHVVTDYVHVSPRSSASDDRGEEYRYRREVRREYSPARSRSRGGDLYEYRHVEPPRSRSRSRRRYDDEYDDGYYDDDRREAVRVSSRRVYRD